MNRTVKDGIPWIHIASGEYYVSDKLVVISTVLGSCIAACLYDPIARVVGMNHFLLAAPSNLHNGQLLTSNPGHYGIHSMELLINRMMAKGANRSRLEAKVFGGANVLDLVLDQRHAAYRIGDNNSRFILSYLENEGIRLKGSDLGGNRARSIHFRESDFSVFLRRTDHDAKIVVGSEERRYLKKSLEALEKPKVQIEVWS